MTWGYDDTPDWKKRQIGNAMGFATGGTISPMEAGVGNSINSYEDPVTGEKKYQGIDPDPFGKGGAYGPGRWGMAHALSDPNSDVSKMHYYGGERGAAAAEYYHLRDKAQALGNAAAPVTEWNNEVPTLQQNAANDSFRTMLGIETAAQRQLGDNYGRVAGSIAGMAQSARPGLMQASARRRAEQAIAGNQQNLANDMGMLRAQEMNRARDMYGNVLGDMRKAGAARAESDASIAEGQKNINSGAVTGINNVADGVAQAGLSGGVSRQASRRQFLRDSLGLTNTERNIDIEQRNLGTRTTLGLGQATGQVLGRMWPSDDDQR